MLTDNKDGTYLAEFMCTKDGDYFIDVKLGLIDIIQSPFVLTVDPADTEPRMCTCFGVENEAGNGLKGGSAGNGLVFRIQAIDKFGNRVHKPGDDFQVSITETIEHIRVRAKVQAPSIYIFIYIIYIRVRAKMQAPPIAMFRILTCPRLAYMIDVIPHISRDRR